MTAPAPDLAAVYARLREIAPSPSPEDADPVRTLSVSLLACAQRYFTRSTILTLAENETLSADALAAMCGQFAAVHALQNLSLAARTVRQALNALDRTEDAKIPGSVRQLLEALLPLADQSAKEILVAWEDGGGIGEWLWLWAQDLGVDTAEITRLATTEAALREATADADGRTHTAANEQTPEAAASTVAPREHLGRVVRDTWVTWAAEQPDPKESWLTGWDELDAGQREVDMRIGEAVAAYLVIPCREPVMSGRFETSVNGEPVPETSGNAVVSSGDAPWAHLACDTAIKGLRAGLEEQQRKVYDYENAITWETSCISCARVLDKATDERERAERAEATLARIRDLCETAKEPHTRPDTGEAGYAVPVELLRAALGDGTGPDTGVAGFRVFADEDGELCLHGPCADSIGCLWGADLGGDSATIGNLISAAVRHTGTAAAQLHAELARVTGDGGPPNGGCPVIWSSAVAPGGWVCAEPEPGRVDGICGNPVESEPCPEHRGAEWRPE